MTLSKSYFRNCNPYFQSAVITEWQIKPLFTTPPPTLIGRSLPGADQGGAGSIAPPSGNISYSKQ